MLYKISFIFCELSNAYKCELHKIEIVGFISTVKNPPNIVFSKEFSLVFILGNF